MLILGIDSSAAPACAAVYDTEKNIVAAETVINGRLTHSTTLMPVVSDLLKNAEIAPGAIDLFAVTVGPGSFTGLRIGISAVKGMAYSLDKPCAAVTSSQAIAYNFSLWQGVICTAIDARAGQVYNGIFRCNNGIITQLVPDRCILAVDLAAELTAYNEKIIVAGDNTALVISEAEKAGVQDIITAPPPLCSPSGHAVCFAAAAGNEYIKANQLMPMYLKLPQAQRELEQRLQAKNVNNVEQEKQA